MAANQSGNLGNILVLEQMDVASDFSTALNMNKNISLHVDLSTWPVSRVSGLPIAFHTRGPISINILAMLQLVGVLTTPPSLRGASINEYWAWIRYFNAFSRAPDLLIASTFQDLDSHQKMILSDDLGVGLPMYWLTGALQLCEYCDGRYFAETYSSILSGVAEKAKKRGPKKSPDFVAKDVNGRWHVIECKGTQGGEKYRDRQLSEGRAQKRMIRVIRARRGERLVCGVALEFEGSKLSSTLKIIDPPITDPISIPERMMDFADEIVFRSMLSTSLRLSGFPDSAQVVSSPKRVVEARARSRRQAEETISIRNLAASAELKTEVGRRYMEIQGRQYVGRKISLDLPATVSEDGIRTVSITQGVNAALIKNLAPENFNPGRISGDLNAKMSPALPITFEQLSEYKVRMSVGDMFMSEAAFEES